MNKTEFLHKLKKVATVQNVLDYIDTDDRRGQLSKIRKKQRDNIFELLDYASKYIPEGDNA